MSLNAEQNACLAAWQENKKQLDYWKEEEAKSRASVGLTIFAEVKEKAETVELGGGYRVTYTPKTNYNLQAPEDGPLTIVEAMSEMGDAMRQASNAGAFVFERLVSWKPSLSVGEYKKLTPELKRIVDRYVVTSEGAPSISIKEPAAAKGK